MKENIPKFDGKQHIMKIFFQFLKFQKKNEIDRIKKTLADNDNVRYRKYQGDEYVQKMVEAAKILYEWLSIDWSDITPNNYLGNLLTSSTLIQWEQFFRENLIKFEEVDLQKKESLVDDNGWTWDVVVALYNWKKVAAKIFKRRKSWDLSHFILEWMSIRLMNLAWVLPTFHGYTIDENWSLVILMDIVEWKDVQWFTSESRTAYKNNNYTEKSISNFKEKMKKNHEIWFSFSDDSGQLRISRKWEIWIIDIFLYPIENICKSDEIQKITDSDWHKETFEKLNVLLNCAKKNRE